MDDQIQIASPPDRTIDEFRAQHRIGKTKYFKDRAAGRGPRELRIGRMVRITAEAEADWVRAHETPTGAEARLAKREREALHRQGVALGKASAASPNHMRKRRKRDAAAERQPASVARQPDAEG